MNWNEFFRGRDRGDWRPVARAFILISLVIFGVEIHNFMRIRAFESAPHTVTEASGPIWLVKIGRKGPSLLFDAGHGQIRLSCEVPTVPCMTPANGGDDRGLAQGKQAAVAWVDGPAGLFSGSAHYPVRIKQLGQLRLEISPADIVEALQHQLAIELWWVGSAMFVLPLLFLLVAGQADKARRATVSAAARRRRDDRGA